MSTNATFGELLDAVDHLPLDEQAELVAVVQRRLADQGRRRVIADVQEARERFVSGAARPVTVDELMREIDS